MNSDGAACSAPGTSKTPSSSATISRFARASATNSPPAGTRPSAGPPITSPMPVACWKPRRASPIPSTRRTTRPNFSARASVWHGTRSATARLAVRAGFGTYYSLIDDLSFLLNSLPPYNGSITASGSLFSITPVVPGAAVPPSCGPGVPAPCTTYAPQGIQADAKTPTVQEWNLSIERQLTASTALRVSYVGSFGYHGLLSVDPNDIPAQICSSAAGCQAGGAATSGTPATAANQSHVAQGAQYIPGGHAAQSVPWRGLLLVHRGQQQVQRAADRCLAPSEPGLRNPRQLHLVEEPGHELGTHRRAVPEPVANDPRPQ